MPEWGTADSQRRQPLNEGYAVVSGAPQAKRPRTGRCEAFFIFVLLTLQGISRRSPSGAWDCSTDIFHQQKEMQGVRRARFKVEMLVEGFRLIVFRMDEQRACTDDISGV